MLLLVRMRRFFSRISTTPLTSVEARQNFLKTQSPDIIAQRLRRDQSICREGGRPSVLASVLPPVTSDRGDSIAVNRAPRQYSGEMPSAIPVSPTESSGPETEDSSLPSPASLSTTMTSGTDANGDNNADDDDEDEDEDDFEFLAKPLLDIITDFITTHVSNYNKDCPPPAAGFATFKSFWRDRFDQMREELVTTQEADLFIMSPAPRVLEIMILDDNKEHRCPCCVVGDEPGFVIRAQGGITREIFLNAVRNYLYGEEVAEVDLALRDEYGGGLLVKAWDWMTHDEGMFFKGGDNTELTIWMYCSGLERKD